MERASKPTAVTRRALAGLLALAACRKSDRPRRPLHFSILATDSAANEQARWSPFLTDMSRQTGLTVRPFYASSYTSLVEAMRFRQVDLGWFSNVPGLEAVKRAGGEVFAHSTYPGGAGGYFANIVVRADSGVTLERLLKCDRKLRFAFGDRESTSGTLAPMAYLFTPRRIDPQTCFKSVRSANHQANLAALAAGELDATANNSTSLTVLARTRPDLATRVAEIWRSPPLPEDPIIWRKALDPGVKEKLRSFFLSYGSAPGPEGERERQILAGLDFGQFKPADDRFLLPIREMVASEALAEARNANDPRAEKAAEAELADIKREKEKAGPSQP